MVSWTQVLFRATLPPSDAVFPLPRPTLLPDAVLPAPGNPLCHTRWSLALLFTSLLECVLAFHCHPNTTLVARLTPSSRLFPMGSTHLRRLHTDLSWASTGHALGCCFSPSPKARGGLTNSHVLEDRFSVPMCLALQSQSPTSVSSHSETENSFSDVNASSAFTVRAADDG